MVQHGVAPSPGSLLEIAMGRGRESSLTFLIGLGIVIGLAVACCVAFR